MDPESHFIWHFAGEQQWVGVGRGGCGWLGAVGCRDGARQTQVKPGRENGSAALNKPIDGGVVSAPTSSGMQRRCRLSAPPLKIVPEGTLRCRG